MGSHRHGATIKTYLVEQNCAFGGTFWRLLGGELGAAAPFAPY